MLCKGNRTKESTILLKSTDSTARRARNDYQIAGSVRWTKPTGIQMSESLGGFPWANWAKTEFVIETCVATFLFQWQFLKLDSTVNITHAQGI